MPTIFNFIDNEHCQINDAITDTHGVLSRYYCTLHQLVNLCGGIPSLDIMYINLTAKSKSEHSIEVDIETDLYHTSRNINLGRGIIINQLMRVYNTRNHIGTSLFLTQVREARRKGFIKIRTTALASDIHEQWDGYYRWARLGYQMEDRNDIDDLEELISFFNRKERNLGELVMSEEGYTFWKQHGFTWNGEFTLAANSASIVHLNKYLALKGIDFRP